MIQRTRMTKKKKMKNNFIYILFTKLKKIKVKMNTQKYLLEYEEFKNIYRPIFENLDNGLPIDIPSFHNTSGQVVLNDIYITTSNGRKFIFSIDEFIEFCKDDLNCSSEVLRALRKVYQSCVIAKVSGDVTVKLDTIKTAETFELFDVSNLGFFDNLQTDLASFGANPSEVWEIQNSLTNLYDTGNTDKMSPNAMHILMKYLDSMLEFAGAKVFMFFKFINQERLIHEPSAELNLDSSRVNSKSKTGEKFLSFDGGTFASGKDTTYLPKANYTDCMIDLNKMVFDVGNKLNVRINNPICGTTGREVTAISKYMKWVIPEMNVSIMSILAPVELKRLGFEKYVFFVSDSSNTKTMDFAFDPIYTVDGIVKAIQFAK